LGLILFLLLGGLNFVDFILVFEPLFDCRIDVGPHITNDFGDLSDFGSRVVGLYLIIDFSSVEEKS